MTFKQFMILIATATGFLWFGWLWTLFTIDPFSTNWIGFALFYLTLFLSFVGSLTLFGVYLRKDKMVDAYFFHLVLLSARQGVFLSSLLVILLIFQAVRWLDMFTLGIILLIAFGLELYFLRQNRKSISFAKKNVDDEPLDVLTVEDTVPPVFEKRNLT